MPESSPIVVAVNTSSGGIPKLPQTSCRVLSAGLESDAHDHDKHNSPRQAVSILDEEDIQDLAREGFAVAAGSTGENLTVRGLSVDGLAIGDRLLFSGGVELELTKRRQPCYVLDQIDPTLKKAIIGRCGYLARVVREGVIRPGDTIRVRSVLTGAILIGGRSSRMGQPKHLMRAADGGTTMLEVIAAALQDVCHQIVTVGGAPEPVAANAERCDVEPESQLIARRHIPDVRPGEGPLAGVEALLLSGISNDYIIVPCDLPRLTAEPIRMLAAAAGPRGRAAVLRIRGSDRFELLPLRVSAAALPVVQQLLDSSQRSVWQLVELLEADIIEAPEHIAEQLCGVNTPDEYQRVAAVRS